MKLLDKFQPNQKSIPWFFLGISVLAFGLLAPWLGFYQDDWHHIYYYSHEGAAGLRHFLFFDSRPFAFVVFEPLFHLFGVDPLGWHIGVLVLRLLMVLVFLGVLNLLWGQNKKENVLVALLFLVYPAFLLQPIAVAYSLHWAMYLVYMLSVWFMLRAVQQKRFFVAFTVSALLLQIFHLLMIEYYVGLEFLRPILLFIAFRNLSGRERIKSTLKAWVPYLLVTLLYIVYRSSFGQIFGYERNAPTVMFGLFTHPLSTVVQLLQAGLQDFVSVLFSAWYETLQPALFDLTHISYIFVWAITLVCLAACWFYFTRLHVDESATDESSSDWAKAMLVVGLLAVLVGVLPGWAVGNTIYTSNSLWNDRFAMAAMFGAAMAWAGAIYLLVSSPVRRYLVFSVLIALAVGMNLRTAFGYKSSWEKQLNFYWQLTWRAPYIKPETAFISDNEFLYFMGVYQTSFAINTLYPQTVQPPQLGYWVYATGKLIPSWDDFRAGSTLQYTKYASTFTGSSSNSLALDFEPEKSQCLWILRPVDSTNKSLSSLTQEFIPASNVDRIRVAAPASWSPPEVVFGKEPAHTWCYYFEKADLARQSGDWNQVIHILEASKKAGMKPDSGVEYVPFIEGYAYTGDWKTASELTLQASRITAKMDSLLCSTWQAIDKSTTSTPAREEVLLKLKTKLQCDLP